MAQKSSSQKNKKVLVTGASGFIASTLIPAFLKAGYSVTGIDRLACTHIPPQKGFAFIKKDIAKVDSLAGFDYVVHLAFATNIPKSILDPVGTTYNNLDLGVKMLELAKQAGVKKFLYPSTASLYGNQPLPWKEDMKVIPGEPYSLQKYAMERFCEYYAKNGLPTVVFRLFQVFGENQRHDTALYKFYQCRKEGKPIPITQTTAQAGFRGAKRDFIYTGDIAEAFAVAMESGKVGKGEVINLCSEYNYTIREVAELISDKIEFIPKRGFELDEHLGDASKAKKLLHFKAHTDIKDWMKKYVKTI
ncbi:MAG: hypothetical protein UY70_C0006G0006 [Candidatus Kaiserbacteria bacterium GW2011_GWB1_52_6]|uniref:NAD-dependent epimerase/dehydratase domain-containing protein n=2 Tax=Candidatus Kaiseribacteriota TaxID=1752734 RepID=A0A0G1XIR8_9BACT|nr:MAG: hypothetical protein UY70_C0006G0006 [Candidatus Kaiserbacteria bacterium GW2011_GWB1_52_6]KKW30810.1 MAG: hypothetical protein UY74_C0031G0008 [Candidatus Kaiserbacteria bacterium GW2011_GWC2_52_8b]